MSDIRARIGYSSVAFVNELLPKYFYEMAPDGVLLQLLTLQITEHTTDQFERLYQEGIAAAESFATAGADVIILGGAPTNISHGKQNLEQALEALSMKFGRPVSSSSMAQKRALRALGARKIGTINPAVPRNFGDSASGSIDGRMELVGRKHAMARLEHYNRIPPSTALELGRELMREHPAIDTLIFGCPHWATLGAIETLEREFDVNVVTALQAIVWEGLRLAGIEDRLKGYGRLLRDY